MTRMRRMTRRRRRKMTTTTRRRTRMTTLGALKPTLKGPPRAALV
jgi:hypothetical protein